MGQQRGRSIHAGCAIPLVHDLGRVEVGTMGTFKKSGKTLIQDAGKVSETLAKSIKKDLQEARELFKKEAEKRNEALNEVLSRLNRERDTQSSFLASLQTEVHRISSSLEKGEIPSSEFITFVLSKMKDWEAQKVTFDNLRAKARQAYSEYPTTTGLLEQFRERVNDLFNEWDTLASKVDEIQLQIVDASDPLGVKSVAEEMQNRGFCLLVSQGDDGLRDEWERKLKQVE